MRRRIIAPLLMVVVLITSCGPSNLQKLHDSLSKAAKSLNAAAKTNRSFYETGIYGITGSPEAIALRQRAATVIHDANEKLITALTLAQNLTEETFAQGKIAVLQTLSQVAAGLSTGNQTIDLVLQSVVTLINQAVILIEAFQAQDLPRVLPEIRTWRLEVVAWAN